MTANNKLWLSASYPKNSDSHRLINKTNKT